MNICLHFIVKVFSRKGKRKKVRKVKEKREIHRDRTET